MPPLFFEEIMNNINIKNLIIEFDLLDEDGAIKSRKRVIDDVSFSIAEGEFVCVLGKNGSGKSTLAKTLNSLIIPTSGDVEVYGLNTKIEDNIPKIRQLVGMAFQNPDNQIVASIVEEDIAFGLENIGIESLEIRNRIDDAMKNLEIYNLKDSIVSKLSGGQKQKVSIAGILAMKPKVIVLDEPTSMIDKVGRIDLLDTVKRLNKEENITIILISHYIEEITYADKVILLNHGKVAEIDTPDNILLKSDLLYDAGLDMPYIAKIATELKKRGKNLKGNETKVSELCRYLK